MFCREVQPISRTMQYRKVMKPMLERKRRARINRCLDELKELMVTALATDGDNVFKLEKADILELTVAHLRKLRHVQEEDKFRSGYTSCAKEVSRYLASVPGVDVCLGTELMTFLGRGLKSVAVEAPGGGYTPPPSPIPSPSPSPVNYSVYQEEEKSMVWRPW